MVKIRLRRVGAKKQPHYRVVVTDSKAPRDGKFIEMIGHYDPRTEPPTMEIDAERAVYWLGTGAQPSVAVQRMLDKLGIVARAEAAKRAKVAPELPIPELEPAVVVKKVAEDQLDEELGDGGEDDELDDELEEELDDEDQED